MTRKRIRERKIIKRLKKERILITETRILIIQEICGYDRIDNVMDLYLGLRKSHAVSSGSVYLCLRLLVDFSILIKFSQGRKSMYKFNPLFDLDIHAE